MITRLCFGFSLALLAGCQTQRPAIKPAEATMPITNTLTALPATQITNRLDPAWLRPGTNSFTLGPGDRLEIEILGRPTTRAAATVGADGRIYYYLLPGLPVWGLTLPQAGEELERGLAKFIREEAHVALALRGVESQRVWLLGRLNAPGVYPLAGPMTLLEAISRAGGPAMPPTLASLSGGALASSLAGGPEEAADLRRSFVLRKGQLLPVDFQRLLRNGDMSQNIYLQADDFIYLPSAISRDVYVLGAVAQAKAVNAARPLTLISAVASAGGTIKDAYLSHVAIVRGSLAQPQISVVDYKAIVHGKVPDALLEPGDIVYVPFTPYQVLTRYVNLILDTFVRTVGANAGSQVVLGGNAPIGVNVPLGTTYSTPPP